MQDRVWPADYSPQWTFITDPSSRISSIRNPPGTWGSRHTSTSHTSLPVFRAASPPGGVKVIWHDCASQPFSSRKTKVVLNTDSIGRLLSLCGVILQLPRSLDEQPNDVAKSRPIMANLLKQRMPIKRSHMSLKPCFPHTKYRHAGS